MSTDLDHVKRHAERSAGDRAVLDAILDAGHHVGSLSTVVDGQPWVVPMLYARAGDRILLHGSTGAGALRHMAAGASAALCVIHLDGWVYAHTLFNSSANYRSAVVRGHLTALSADETAAALTAVSDRLFPGRSAEVPAHSRKELAATQALALDIVDGQWTTKVRTGPPSAPEDGDDVAPGLWMGTLPIRPSYGTPETAAWTEDGVPVSPSVARLLADD